VRRAWGLSWRGAAEAAIWTLPCCYDPALAEDLDEAARILGLTRDEAVAFACEGDLSRLHVWLHAGPALSGRRCRRRSRYRAADTEAAASGGAVLIGGGLCVVAPFVMPNRLVCHRPDSGAPLCAERRDAFLIQAGDILRFDPIDLATFRNLEQRAASGKIVAHKSAA